MINIVQKLKDHGFAAFVVGGAVRDLIIGISPSDFDIATNAMPHEVLHIFPHGKHVGRNFPIVIVDGVEVATFRSEKNFNATDRTDVEWVKVDTIEEDLSRRDFTMNAIALDVTTDTWIDPFEGLVDIVQRRIRFVGQPSERIIEDPLRMLRAVRFAVQLDFGIERESLTAIKQHASFVTYLSQERIRDEFIKIIMSNNPTRGIELLHSTKILQFIIAELMICDGFKQNRHHDEDVLEHLVAAVGAIRKKDLSLRLSALFHDVGKPNVAKFCHNKQDTTFHAHETSSARIVERILKRLKFDNKTIEQVVWLVNEHMFFFNEDTRLSRVKVRMAAADKLGLNIRHLMRLRIADRKANRRKSDRPLITHAFKRTLEWIRTAEKENAALTISDLKVNGHDLITLGLKPGPVFKEILDAVLDKVLSEQLADDRDAQMAFVLELVNTNQTQDTGV